MNELKINENRLRRAAARQGLQLTKSSRKDPNALDFGLYALLDIKTNVLVSDSIDGHYAHGWTLERVESYLTPKPKKKRVR